MASENPFDATDVEDTPSFLGAWRDDKLVVVSHNGVLPNRCIGCNKPASHFYRQRFRYDQTIVKNMPQREQAKGFFIPMSMLFLLWAPASYYAGKTALVKNHPWSYFVVSIGLLMLGVWIVSFFTRRRQKEPVRFGLCFRHHSLRLVGNCTAIAGLLGALLISILFDFRNVADIKGLNTVQVAAVSGVLFVLGTLLKLIETRAFYPILAKEDEERRWIKGLSKAYRDSLPEWQPITEAGRIRNSQSVAVAEYHHRNGK